jgi:endoglucanase
VDEEAAAFSTARSLRSKEPDKAKLLDRIANEPQAFWIGDWNQDIFRTVQHFVNRAMQVGAVPVMIAYNVPHRDCGQYSKGGLSAKEEYQDWIRRVALAIGDRPAVIVLEPDALGHIQECLTKTQIEERFFLIKDAVRVLRQNKNTAVYIDAGHARWVKAPDMAERLKKAGIESAHGFALNTSNYVGTEENTEYGKTLSGMTGGSHFVIDTSRNGAGPAAKDEWCNPKGRKIGLSPSTEVDDPVVDAYLWLKRPGESDGECNGGPKAGAFWVESAIELAR